MTTRDPRDQKIIDTQRDLIERLFDRVHLSETRYSKALAALTGGQESTPAGFSDRDACLAAEAVIDTFERDPGFRAWWLALGTMGCAHYHDEAAKAVLRALSGVDVDPAVLEKPAPYSVREAIKRAGLPDDLSSAEAIDRLAA